MYRRSFITSFLTIPACLKVADEYMPPGEIKDGQMLRIWKLGNMDKGIYPTANTVNKLMDILYEWDHTSSIDIVWGPDLELQQCQLDGSFPVDLIQIQHSITYAVDILVKNIPELEPYKDRMRECLEEGLGDNSGS